MNQQLTKTGIFNIVSIIKAFAICMVVFTHVGIGKGNQLYESINQFLVPLRMPVFMFVSGFLYFYVTRDKYPIYSDFISEKLKRLIIPLFIIKILHLIIRYIKLPVSLLFMPDTKLVPVNLSGFVIDMLFFPKHDQLGYHLWFVYTLFLIFALVHLFSDKIYLLTSISLVLFFIPTTDFLGLNFIRIYLIFFCLGGILQLNLHPETLIIRPWMIIVCAAIGLIVLFILNNVGIVDNDNSSIYTFIKFLLGIVVVVSISTLLSFYNNQITKHLRFIGNYSACIYFLHAYFYQIFAVVIHRYYIGCSDLVLWFMIFIGLLIGVYTPILVDKYLISKSQIVGLLLLGRRMHMTPPDH